MFFQLKVRQFTKFATLVHAVFREMVFKNVVVVSLLVGLSGGLSGCDKIKSLIGGDDTDAPQTPETQSPKGNKEAEVSAHDEDGLYPFSKWQQIDVPSVSIGNTAQILSAMQASSQKRESWLDFAGNNATLYNLTDKTEYINLVESPNYLEINWFRTSENDTPESQVVSKDNTKKAYILARSVLGAGGESLIKAMLTNEDEAKQDIAEAPGMVNNQINGKKIMMARCDYFDCMLVIKK